MFELSLSICSSSIDAGGFPGYASDNDFDAAADFEEMDRPVLSVTDVGELDEASSDLVRLPVGPVMVAENEDEV